MKPEEREAFKTCEIQKFIADVAAKKNQARLDIKVFSEQEKRLIAQLPQGEQIEPEVRSQFQRGIILSIFLPFAVCAEFLFTKNMVSVLGLGTIASYILAGSIIAVSLEGMDHYLTAYRTKYPDNTNLIFLFLGSICVVLIILMFLFAAEIRDNIYKATSGITDLQSRVDQANKFETESKDTYIWLMVSLTLAAVIVGGMSYHLAKNLITRSLPMLRIFRELRKTRNSLNKVSRDLTAQDARVARFEAEFTEGLMEEQLKQSRNKTGAGRFALLPITLIAISILIFILFKNMAWGADYIVPFDISKSTSVKGYSGNAEFRDNVQAVSVLFRQLKAGDSIKVLAIKEESFARPQMLVSKELTKEKGAFGEKLARQQLDLIKKWDNLNLKANAKATDIFGAINLASVMFRGKERRLIIFSDMRQCSGDFDLEKPDRIDWQSVLSRVKISSLIPDLAGVKVWCLGVHSVGKSPVYWQNLKMFWEKYFEQAKAQSLTYSMERSGYE
jgi:hypothetical protein